MKRLSPRQRQIVSLAGNRKTVAMHRQHILRKTNARNMPHAIQIMKLGEPMPRFWGTLGEIIPKIAGALSNGDQLTIEDCAHLAEESLFELWRVLRQKAKGKDSSCGEWMTAASLIDRLQEWIEDLERLEDADPDFFTQLKKTRFLWPGLLSRDPDRNHRNERTRSDLGAVEGLNLQGKTFSHNLNNRIVMRLYDELNGYRRAHDLHTRLGGRMAKVPILQPLTKSNGRRDWWPYIEKLFLQKYGENFEDSKDFKSYWSRSCYEGLAEHSKRSLIRSHIKNDLKQSLVSIAPHAPHF